MKFYGARPTLRNLRNVETKTNYHCSSSLRISLKTALSLAFSLRGLLKEKFHNLILYHARLVASEIVIVSVKAQTTFTTRGSCTVYTFNLLYVCLQQKHLGKYSATPFAAYFYGMTFLALLKTLTTSRLPKMSFRAYEKYIFARSASYAVPLTSSYLQSANL